MFSVFCVEGWFVPEESTPVFETIMKGNRLLVELDNGKHQPAGPEISGLDGYQPRAEQDAGGNGGEVEFHGLHITRDRAGIRKCPFPVLEILA